MSEVSLKSVDSSEKNNKSMSMLGNVVEYLKSARETVSNWLGKDEKGKNEPSLTGIVFTGGHALMFGAFFFYTAVAFSDILIPYNLTLPVYAYFYGSFALAFIFSGFIFIFLLAMLKLECLSDDDGVRWPLTTSLWLFPALFKLSNMAGEPHPDLKRDIFDSDIRYPEFLSRISYIVMINFCQDITSCFGPIVEESSLTFMFRPFKKHNSKETRIYEENLSGLIGAAFIYFSLLYYALAGSKNIYDFLAYVIGVRLVRSFFGRGSDFERGRKFSLFIVPILVSIQGYYSYISWISYGSDLVFFFNASFFVLQMLLFVGWHCPQDTLLGSIALPFIRTADFVNVNFDANDDDDEDEEEEKEENVESEDDESEENKLINDE